MLSVYSLDNQINEFFKSHSPVTRTECDELSISLIGAPIKPVSIQGCFSYTVVAGPSEDKIVQFRDSDSILNMEMLELAREIHGAFVPHCKFHGKLGEESPLSIYVMEKIPGITYIEARCIDGCDISSESPDGLLLRRSNTVVDYARFFAQAWKHKQAKLADFIATLHHEYEQKLDVLSDALPSRFTEILTELRLKLPSLFSLTYPLVLTHDDLCEMNILIDPTTEHITGIIDWADASIAPFGTALWGAELTLGYMDRSGWHCYVEHNRLTRLFWQTFEDAVGGLTDTERHTIHDARMIGFFLRYGFSMNEQGARTRPVTESDTSIKYLDAFCLSKHCPEMI